ncbi:uncharacterized protein LOC110027183 [Phalaenopsis equestris]|uniref:uncharacterized protein LOC110027183 n=1 Tax=Phalaenopsis equestris TaxID=78828 RepID=UPI0009E47B7C|nr:uncharacterized protein LOC110027183 [Phalaenopsis equestris]XP_020584163.1 uncharacterized protein LOC110027183 [Phalaenopsis equestris]
MVRCRVFFDDPRLLNNRQLSDGLSRCWVLLKPSIATFDDLASHLREKFAIGDPLSLFIDDFVLPPFLSTCFLNDEDIIRVKLLNAKQKNDLSPCDGQNAVQDPPIGKANGMPFNNNVMKDEKFEANSQGNGNNENAAHDSNLSLRIGVMEQNREHSPEFCNSMKKRQKLNCTEKQTTGIGVRDIHSRKNKTFCNLNGGSKMNLPAKDNTHDGGLIDSLPVSEVSLGESSSSMPCNGRQQSGGTNNTLESEPHIACDVNKEFVLSNATTSKQDHNQFTAAIFKGRTFCGDANEKDLSGFCMENHALLGRKREGDSSDKKAKNAMPSTK